MMKKKSNKGFTLVELIVVIILLGIVGTVVVYNMTSVSNTSKDTEYKRFIASVKSAANVYADMNPEAFDDLYVTRSYIYIKIDELIKAGLLDENLVNPYTGEKVKPNDLIKANLDGESGAIVFEYPIEGEEENETFLVALSDYVVWGEPYDCMQGAGSYQLALSEEDGSLVMLKDKATIEQYKFTCSMPDNFDAQKAGNYTITYSWVTSSGTRKNGTRLLRVLPKLRPTMNFYMTGGSAGTNRETVGVAKPDTGTGVSEITLAKVTPSITGDCTSYKHLEFSPNIEGADTGNTIYTIEKIVDSPNVAKASGYQLVIRNSSDFNKSFVADDGKMLYKITTSVKGHYVQDYQYEAVGYVHTEQELIIPDCKVTGTNKTWGLNKTFGIKDGVYSPSGLTGYEYKIVSDTEKAPVNNSSLDSVEKANFFNSVAGGSSKTVSMACTGADCANTSKRYKKIYFRAVNNNGYVGKWTSVKDAYLSNNLSDLINSNRGSDCNSSCAPSSSDAYLKGLGIECNYCNKSVWAKYGNTSNMDRLVVLGLYADTNKDEIQDVLVSAHSDTKLGTVSATTLHKNQVWTIVTCDGTYSATYSYRSVAFDNIKKYLTTSKFPVPSNYQQLMVNNLWKANIGTINLADMPNEAAYKSEAARKKWEAWNNALKKKEQKYTSYFGLPTVSDVASFDKALYPVAGNSYWLGTSYSSGFQVKVSHGDSTTMYNTYLYVLTSTGVSATYIGENHSANPMMRFARAYVSNGVGTKANPYVISGAEVKDA